MVADTNTNRLKLLLLLAPGLGLILMFIGLVLYMALAQSFGLYNLNGESQLTLHHWQEMLSKKRFWNAFGYSAYIAWWSAILSVILAYPITLWLRKPFFGSSLISSLLKAPLLIPGLAVAFLMINVISFHGFLNEFMLWAGIIDKPIRMQNDKNGYGVIFLQVWKQLPFAFLLLSGAVQGLPDNILNAAQDLGANAWSRFAKIIFPLTIKATQSALVLIFIGAAADFTFQAVAGPRRENSLSTLMSYTQSSIGDWNGAAVIAVMLMVLSLVGALLMAGLASLLARSGGKIR